MSRLGIVCQYIDFGSRSFEAKGRRAVRQILESLDGSTRVCFFEIGLDLPCFQVEGKMPGIDVVERRDRSGDMICTLHFFLSFLSSVRREWDQGRKWRD